MAYTIEQLEEIVDHEYLHYDEAMSIARQLIATMRANAKLAEFARYVIRQECWCQDLDGGDVQEKATTLGLLNEGTLTADNIEELRDIVDEYGLEMGDPVFVFSYLIKEK